MHIILVGNYVIDGQESMQRYAELLFRELSRRGFSVELIRPAARFGRLCPAARGLGKWLGYLDKFLLFPFTLRRAVSRHPDSVVHICDHSNAFYAKSLRGFPAIVTCHDVLAIRSALGHFAENPTGWTGRKLQKLILAGLRESRLIACVSEETRRQLIALGGFDQSAIAVVANALNYPFVRLSPAEQSEILAALPVIERLPREGFVFHVGGNQWYKNRGGVLRIYLEYVRSGGRLPLVMAGKPITAELRAIMEGRPPEADVIFLESLSSRQLNALYSRAACLLFPSLQEGFGWPIVEAMASGCLVMTSGHPPMSEVGGGAATFIDPRDEEAAGRALVGMLSAPAAFREMQRHRGLEQSSRFSTQRMIDAFVSRYRHLELSSGAART